MNQVIFMYGLFFKERESGLRISAFILFTLVLTVKSTVLSLSVTAASYIPTIGRAQTPLHTIAKH